METEAEAILTVSQTLESADFTRDQSDAFIKSVALSMKTFAVTPKVLDEHLDARLKPFNDKFKAMNDRLDKTNDRFDGLLETVHDFKRSMLSFGLAFLATFAGFMGVIVTLLATP